MSYFSLYYHFIWHTKNSFPILKGNQERRIHEIIKSIVYSSPEMFFVASGGTDTHVHVILYSKSTITVAHMAKLMKGGSSEMINQERLFPFRFSWQHEYGCVTFGKNDLQNLRLYVSKQRVHHSQNTTDVHLECTDFRDGGSKHAWGDDD
jgi:putative transposase